MSICSLKNHHTIYIAIVIDGHYSGQATLYFPAYSYVVLAIRHIFYKYVNDLNLCNTQLKNQNGISYS